MKDTIENQQIKNKEKEKKRSEITLGEDVFVIKKPIAYISRRNTIEKAYVCLGLTLGRTETFEESDIALTNNPNIYQ